MTATNGAGAAGAASAIANPRPAPIRKPHVLDRMDALADHMAEGGTFKEFAAIANVDPSRVHQMWRDICTDLGPQAAIPKKPATDKPAPKREPRTQWCPPEYRDLNSRMTSGGFSLEERKRIIADDIAKKAGAEAQAA